jgi:hypothetical protein
LNEPDRNPCRNSELSFAERQELVRRAIEVEDDELTSEEKTILDQRLDEFRRNPESGGNRLPYER